MRTNIKDWLAAYLREHGPTRRNVVVKAAWEGFICSPSALDRAAVELGLPKGWFWRLPE